jgi:hypothetical protein
MNNSNISIDRCLKAIENGLLFLEKTQHFSGEWATLESPYIDLRDSVEVKNSPYLTSFVVHALQTLTKRSQISVMQFRASQFLISQRKESGAWNYFGLHQTLVPDDLDDTCCAIAALIESNQLATSLFSLFFLILQNEHAPGGPYYTWLGVNDLPEMSSFMRDLDPLINANIIFCFSLLQLELPGAIIYLKKLVLQADWKKNLSRYGVPDSVNFLLYCVSRAVYFCPALAPIKPILLNYLLNELPSVDQHPSAFNLACIAASLFNCDADNTLVKPYLDRLLLQQALSGEWPAWAAWYYRKPSSTYCGSPALTTALALEAIGKSLAQSG